MDTHSPAHAPSHDASMHAHRQGRSPHEHSIATDGGHGTLSLNRLALAATVHCLTGCAIGEVLGLVIGTALGLGTLATIGLAVALAFVFGFGLTMLPLLRSGMPLRQALGLAIASDLWSISTMEVVDNALMLAIPGAMDASLGEPLFWGSMGAALLIAGVAAYPINRWLIARGRGHAVMHAHHH